MMKTLLLLPILCSLHYASMAPVTDPVYHVTGGPVTFEPEEPIDDCDGYPSTCDRTCGCPEYTIDSKWVDVNYPGDGIGDLFKVPLKWNGCTPVPQECAEKQIKITIYQNEYGLMPEVTRRFLNTTRICNRNTKKYELKSDTYWWSCFPNELEE